MLSIVKLSDVNGEPKFKKELPSLKVGDPIALRLVLDRQTAGRYEILEVNHRFRVTAVGYDDSSGPTRQLLSVESAERPPTWRSVRKPASEARRLGPTVFDRTPIR